LHIDECASRRISPLDVSSAAMALYHVFVRDGKYGVVDKLGLASAPDSLLVALYEVDRGVRAAIREPSENLSNALKALDRVIVAIASDVRNPACLEEAIRLAHELAVKALAGGGRH